MDALTISQSTAIRAVMRPLANAAVSAKIALGRMNARRVPFGHDELSEMVSSLDAAMEALSTLEVVLARANTAGQVQREADLRPGATLRVRAASAVSLLQQADILARAGRPEEADESRQAALGTLERGLALVAPFSPVEAKPIAAE